MNKYEETFTANGDGNVYKIARPSTNRPIIEIIVDKAASFGGGAMKVIAGNDANFTISADVPSTTITSGNTTIPITGADSGYMKINLSGSSSPNIKVAVLGDIIRV